MAPWLIWLILAGALAAGEAVSGTFILLMMSGGALAGAVTAAFAPAAVQVIVAIVARSRCCGSSGRSRSGT